MIWINACSLPEKCQVNIKCDGQRRSPVKRHVLPRKGDRNDCLVCWISLNAHCFGWWYIDQNIGIDFPVKCTGCWPWSNRTAGGKPNGSRLIMCMVSEVSPVNTLQLRSKHIGQGFGMFFRWDEMHGMHTFWPQRPKLPVLGEVWFVLPNEQLNLFKWDLNLSGRTLTCLWRE